MRTFDFNFGSFDDWFKVLDSFPWGEVQRLPETLVSCAFPPCDWYIDDQNNSTFVFALAGVKQENVSITFRDDHLYLDIDPEPVVDKVKYLQKGIKRSKSSTRYYVPVAKYNVKGAKATFKDGILTISIPVNEDSKPLSVAITVD